MDSSGALVAGVKVTGSKTSEKAKCGPVFETRITDEDGKFSLQAPAGAYDLTVEKKKFKLTQVKSVEVVAGKVSQIKIGLAATKSEIQTIVICDPPGPIQTTSSEINRDYGNDCSGSLMKGAPQPRDLGDLLNK